MSNHPHMRPGPMPAPGPAIVTPSAIPFTFNVGEAMKEGKRALALQFATPQGLTVLFCFPEEARQLADIINRAASGIVVRAPILPGLN